MNKAGREWVDEMMAGVFGPLWGTLAHEKAFADVMERRCARGDEDIEFLVNSIAMADFEIARLTAFAEQCVERARQEEWERCIEECAIVALHACLDPPDGGSPTQAEFLVCEEAAKRIRALTPPSQGGEE